MSCWLQLKHISNQPLLATALLTSLAWYLFWVVMAPVEKDIAHIFNWYVGQTQWSIIVLPPAYEAPPPFSSRVQVAVVTA